MTKERYIQHRIHDEIIPIAFKWWSDKKKKGYRELTYHEFTYYFSQFFHSMHIDFNRIWEYYDKEFNIVFLKDKNGKTFKIVN